MEMAVEKNFPKEITKINKDALMLVTANVAVL